MLPDAGTLIILAAASCIVAPALVCAFCGPVENTSRAIQNDPRKVSNRHPPGSSPTDTTGDDVSRSFHSRGTIR